MRRLAALPLAFTLACTGATPGTEDELAPFTSTTDLENYLARLEKPESRNSFAFGEAAPEAASDSSATAGSGEPGNEGITNTQEANVDEGGIVKNIGDYLVVLRKGRLYAVHVGVTGVPTQTDTIAVAPSADLNGGVWYDELLVKGRELVVIGYRYSLKVVDEAGHPLDRYFGATELARFSLSDAGTFTRGALRFIESNDYYSSRNYASRLVGDQLVFYMPYGAFRYDTAGRQMQIPRFVRHLGGTSFQAVGPMFDGTQVMRPVRVPGSSPVFHTVVRCSLDLDCEARAVLSDWSREHYTSAQAIYLAVDDAVYRVGLLDGSTSVHAISGAPIDQFSFRERNGVLELLTRRSLGTATDPRTGQRQSYGSVDLLELPLAAFDATGTQDVTAVRRSLTWGPSTSAYRNRFVGDAVYVALWGGGGQSLLIHDLATRTQRVDPSGYVSRLEPMSGVGGLVVDSDPSTRALRLKLLLHGATGVTAAPVLELAGVREGEWRSHGFFFKPSAQGGGRFGLPVVGSGSGWWGRGVSNIAFFDVTAQAGVALSGTVSSSVDAGGQCETSCVDWYGNTRPIFLKDRLFALMGSELQELSPTGGTPALGQRVLLSF
jgi:hypothetical protein